MPAPHLMRVEVCTRAPHANWRLMLPSPQRILISITERHVTTEQAPVTRNPLNTPSTNIHSDRRDTTGDHGVANAHARLNGTTRSASQPLRSPVAPDNSTRGSVFFLHLHARCAAERGLFGLLVCLICATRAYALAGTLCWESS